MTANQIPTPTPGAPAPKKGPNILLWLLLGCGGIMFLGLLVVVGLSMFVWSKVKEAGFDPALMERNPELAAAKIAVSANPEAEFVSMDETKGTITYKVKKTGALVTLNYKQINEGKWSMETTGPNGQRESVEIGGGEDGKFEVRTEKGTATLGGEFKAPAWVPLYPGSQPKGVFSTENEDGDAGSFTFDTTGDHLKIAQFYEDKFKAAGMKVTRNTQTGDDQTMIMLAGESKDEGRTLQAVIVRGTDDKINVNVIYHEKK